MPINRLDHYSIRTTDLAATERFYTEVMGFEVGPRPNFPFLGAWLYQGGVAVVHVVAMDPNNPEGLKGYLGDKPMESSGTGTIDHIAFVGTEVEAVRAHPTPRAEPALDQPELLQTRRGLTDRLLRDRSLPGDLRDGGAGRGPDLVQDAERPRAEPHRAQLGLGQEVRRGGDLPQQVPEAVGPGSVPRRGRGNVVGGRAHGVNDNATQIRIQEVVMTSACG